MSTVIGKSRRGVTKKLGRVAKVAAEQSFLRCGGQPPAQRDAGYRPEGPLSMEINPGSFGRFWFDAPASDLKQNQSLQLKSRFSARISQPEIREPFLSADAHPPRLKLNSNR